MSEVVNVGVVNVAQSYIIILCIYVERDKSKGGCA